MVNLDYIKGEDIKDASNLIFDSFSNDPYSWSVAVGFCLKKLERWISCYVSNRVLLKDPPSIVAKIKNQVVGVCTIDDYNNQPEQPDNNEINNMYNACDNIIKKNLYDLEKIAYISFIAVNKDYRRKNIADSMITYSNKILKDLGYKYSVAFCTSYRSKNLFEKNGYKYLGGIFYKDFKTDSGSTPFINMPDDKCSVMILSL